MAKYYKADGTEQEVHPKNGEYFELDELQQLVGGFIELTYIVIDDELKRMCFDEEGKLKYVHMGDDGKLHVDEDKLNRKATFIAQEYGFLSPFDFIVGNAIMLDDNEVR